MKELCLGAALLLAATAGHAQNKNLEGKYAVKLYNTTSWQEQESSFASGIFQGTTNRKDFRLLHPSAAFRITNKRNNMHEIELTQLELGSVREVSSVNGPSGTTIPISGGKTTQTNIALRYEYIINFMKKKNSRLMPALGLALMPYLERSSFVPALSTSYPATATGLGTKAWVIPRISYAISSKFFIDLNVPLCITDVNVQWNNQQNPNLTQGEQKSEVSNFEGAPQNYSVRLGIGLKV
jgi:hypothetical protein